MSPIEKEILEIAHGCVTESQQEDIAIEQQRHELVSRILRLFNGNPSSVIYFCRDGELNTIRNTDFSWKISRKDYPSQCQEGSARTRNQKRFLPIDQIDQPAENWMDD